MADPTPYFESMLSAAASALTEGGFPAGRVVMASGAQPAWDECCNGMLYLRTLAVYPTAGPDSPFPSPETHAEGAAPGTCPRLMAWHLGVGLLRCAATLDDQGNPPSAAALSANGAEQNRDIDLLMQMILCVYPTLPGLRKVKIDRWTPAGPEGGCTGGEWGFYVAIDPCQCQ